MISNNILLSNETNSWMKLVLNLPNKILAPITGRKKTFPIWLCSFILGTFIFLPSYLLATVLGEKEQLKDIGWTVFISLELSYLSIIAMYIDLHLNIFKQLQEMIIPVLADESDYSNLKKLIHSATNLSPNYSIVLLTIIIGVTALVGGTMAYGNSPGVGLAISAIFFGFFGSISIYYILWVLKLTYQLGKYKYTMNEFVPASSKIISDISSMLNIHTYIIALFLAAVTAIDSLDRLTSWFILADIILGWIPVTAQFFSTQDAIRKIISSAKWNALEQIQTEIGVIKNTGKLKDKDTVDAINRLIDLQDRIEKTKDSTLNFRSGLDFINQLLLPIISWIVVNIEKMLTLIKAFFK